MKPILLIKLLMTTGDQTIKLDQFLKWVGAASTGGEAKMMIQGGLVKVNGTSETRRGRQISVRRFRNGKRTNLQG
jgi:ribosome-associated protein